MCVKYRLVKPVFNRCSLIAHLLYIMRTCLGANLTILLSFCHHVTATLIVYIHVIQNLTIAKEHQNKRLNYLCQTYIII